jgi:hypothetical protein
LASLSDTLPTTATAHMLTTFTGGRSTTAAKAQRPLTAIGEVPLELAVERRSALISSYAPACLLLLHHSPMLHPSSLLLYSVMLLSLLLLSLLATSYPHNLAIVEDTPLESTTGAAPPPEICTTPCRGECLPAGAVCCDPATGSLNPAALTPGAFCPPYHRCAEAHDEVYVPPKYDCIPTY